MSEVAIRVLSVVDAYTRECLALEVDTSFASRRVTRVLEAIIAERGAPQVIRCDNGPELTSRHFLAWCIERKIELVHIQPGRPMQNGRVESFHGKLRDECLRVSWFGHLFEARRKIVAWQKEYNQERPHSSLGTGRRRRLRAKSAAERAVEKTVAAPPWKTLRVSHFPTAPATTVNLYPGISLSSKTDSGTKEASYDLVRGSRGQIKTTPGRVPSR